ARIMPIYEGTTAIQSNDLIGRKVIRDGGATAESLFARIAETAVALRAQEHPVAQRTAERLERAVGSARAATAALLGFGQTRDAYGVSVPYLMLLGTLSGAWMHALALVAVLGHETQDEADKARIVSADFYGAHHLPRVHMLAETVAAGEVV
ncbi:MAG: acyl-CoA dehydrogenase, partial [Actinobacteria bacterium]|nr:acyl-CoA dehydrogenase [Actinomycetota bacterium]